MRTILSVLVVFFITSETLATSSKCISKQEAQSVLSGYIYVHGQPKPVYAEDSDHGHFWASRYKEEYDLSKSIYISDYVKTLSLYEAGYYQAGVSYSYECAASVECWGGYRVTCTGEVESWENGEG